MDDTVSSAMMVSSLESDETMVLNIAPVTTAVDALHINGALHAEAAPVGLTVEFGTVDEDSQVIVPAAPSSEPSATVSGAAAVVSHQAPDIVAGALQQEH